MRRSPADRQVAWLVAVSTFGDVTGRQLKRSLAGLVVCLPHERVLPTLALVTRAMWVVGLAGALLLGGACALVLSGRGPFGAAAGLLLAGCVAAAPVWARRVLRQRIPAV